jgi:acetyltransferase-like isoleucine patch superfamily enzyme
MTKDPTLAAFQERLQALLQGESDERLLCQAIGHPSRPTGLCHCDQSLLATLRITLRAVIMQSLLAGPFNRPKLVLLRWLGARIGDPVYLSPGVWIDPTYPQLLTIEDEVFLGMGVRITTHEFRRHELRVGRVILRRGSFIGAHAMIGCGIEVGEGATVAAGAALARDVPAGCTAIGNPARIIRRSAADGPSRTSLR